MVHVVQASLIYRTVARRDAVAAAIQARFDDMPPWRPADLQSIVDLDGDPTVTFEVGFLADAVADAFYNALLSSIGTGITGPRPGSRVWRHECPRNEDQTAGCVIAAEQVW